MSELEERLFFIRRAADNLKFVAIGLNNDICAAKEEAQNAVDFATYFIIEQLDRVEELIKD